MPAKFKLCSGVSHMLYGIELYANTCKSFLTKLSTLNNKLLRVLQFAKIELPVLSLYCNFNILPIYLLFQRQLLHFLYTFLYCRDLIPIAFHKYFILNLHVQLYMYTTMTHAVNLICICSNVEHRSVKDVKNFKLVKFGIKNL